ncbi:MAG: pilus assembly protein PilM [Endomicrobiaceae bacterium]|nr:pilus assembly protein PilM [Endomicrobiaceae bacterium]
MIGIDLGSKFLKVCKILSLAQKNKDCSIVSAMVDISTLNHSAKTASIAALLKKMDIEKESIYLAVSGKDVINREMVLSRKRVNSKNIKNEIKIEIESTISGNLDTMYSSYTLFKNISERECNILFSAVPKEKVNAKFSLFGSLEDMSVAGVNLESFALANSFNTFGPDYKNSESILLINIGHTITNLIVLSNKELVFLKDVEFGGKDITKEIASFYVIHEKLAEEIKRREDLRQNVNFNMKAVLKKTLPSLIETIFRTIEHCVTRQFILSVDRIVLTGGGALTEGIDSFFEEILGIPTTKWNPLENNKVVGYCNKDSGYFLPVALGLALEKEKK